MVRANFSIESQMAAYLHTELDVLITQRKSVNDINLTQAFQKVKVAYPKIPFQRVEQAVKNIQTSADLRGDFSWQSNLLHWYSKALGQQMPRKKPKLMKCLLLMFCEEMSSISMLEESFAAYPVILTKSWKLQLSQFQSKGYLTKDLQLTDQGKCLQQAAFTEMILIIKDFLA
jgi:hypothetical protein